MFTITCTVVLLHDIEPLPVVQSQISKQDSQIKSLQAERASLAAQVEDMRANLHTATSLADQQVSIKISGILSLPVLCPFTLLSHDLLLTTRLDELFRSCFHTSSPSVRP